MKAKSYLCTALLLSIATPALAEADWVLVASSNLGTNPTYVDKSSIRIMGEIRRFWVRTEYANDADGWARAMTVYEDNCATDQHRLLQLNVYKVDGTNQSIPVDGSPWKYVIPGAIEGIVHDYVCKQ